MSTKFGVHKLNDRIELVDDQLPDEYLEEGIIEEDFIEVAIRGSSGWIVWIKELAEFLPDDLRVYPLDNSAQGIYTIGDIKRKMVEYYESK